ncbi:MAG: hemerythrin domain-containing protein, partial [Bacteroidales bacterium]|nr:hemerythrin domain-containing protein [Bacteroidales bacterium]
NFILPNFENQLLSIKRSGIGNTKDFELLNKFYLEYKNELLVHIKDEDKNIFPYVLAVQDIIDNKKSAKEFYSIFSNRSIANFEKEHENMEMKMNDLKNLILKYLPPIYDQNLCNRFLITLMNFEEDLRDHARIEDKILIPKVTELEKVIHRINGGK